MIQRLGERTVDLATGAVEGRGVLRPRELALLVFLLENAGRTVSEQELLRAVWGYRAEVRTRTLYSTVYRLRALIEEDPRKPTLLVAERGEGYRLVLQEKPLLADMPLDSLIGRQPLVEMLLRELRERRLVVLTGGPGLGKSRLASELAWHQGRQGWGVHRVRAAEAGFLASLASAAGLQLAREDERALQGLVQQVLAERVPAMLLVDDAHLLAAPERAWLERLLGTVPGLALVATARGPLGLAGERVVEVGPLGLPDAVELLRDRAGPGVEASDDALERIARRLEGIPLALLLAASLVRLLGARNTEARLSSSLAALDLGNPAAPGLAAALERAWDTLSAPEQQALGQLCVFRGGFTLEAASAVLARDATEPVLQLRRSSLVRVQGERFALFDAVREFVAVRAPQSAWSQATERHGDWFLAVISLRPQLRSERYGEVRRALAPDLANLDAAVLHLAEHGRSADACALLAFLFDLREGDASLDELLALLERGAALAGADDARSWFDATRARLYAAVHRLGESLAAAERAYSGVRSDPIRRASALSQLIASSRLAGQRSRTEALSLELEAQLPALPVRVQLDLRLRLAAEEVADARAEQAVVRIDALLPLLDECEADASTRAYALGLRGSALALFDPERGEAELREVRAWHLRSDSRHRAQQLSVTLARLLLRTRRPDEALALLQDPGTRQGELSLLRAWARWSLQDEPECERELMAALQACEGRDCRLESRVAAALAQLQRSQAQLASAERWFVRALGLVRPVHAAWADEVEAWLADLEVQRGREGPARERLARLGPGWRGRLCAELRLAGRGELPPLPLAHDLCDRMGTDLVGRDVNSRSGCQPP